MEHKCPCWVACFHITTVAFVTPNHMKAKLVGLLGICALGTSPLLAEESAEMAAFRKQIEAQLAEMKTGYEGKIKDLETRIDDLETDNARLKKNGITASIGSAKKADDDQIEDIEERVSDLENLANHTDPKPIQMPSLAFSKASKMTPRSRGKSSAADRARPLTSQPSTRCRRSLSFMAIFVQALA
jgi:hypothetical protein